MQSPLHPEAPGPEDWAQVVATGSGQVRSYLAGQVMPAEEIARLIAEAYRAGAVTFPKAPAPDRPGERRRLSLVDNTLGRRLVPYRRANQHGGTVRVGRGSPAR
jgi:hypothetical protein